MPDVKKQKKTWEDYSLQEKLAMRFKEEEDLGVERGGSKAFREKWEKKIEGEKDPKKKNILQKAWEALKDKFGLD